jgi:hypothetical protein
MEILVLSPKSGVSMSLEGQIMTLRLRPQTLLGRRLTFGLRVWDHPPSTSADRTHKAPFYHFQTPNCPSRLPSFLQKGRVDASCTRMAAGPRLQHRDPD